MANYDEYFGPGGTGTIFPSGPTGPAPASPADWGHVPSDQPMPDFLRGHEAWARQWAAEHGGWWPREQELGATTAAWWNEPNAAQSKKNYLQTYGVTEAADTFMRNHGRMPGLAEMPKALQEWAYSKLGVAPSTEELSFRDPGAIVAKEMAPILQGAGSGVYQRLAKNSYTDYARYAANVGEGKPAPLSFGDYLRAKLPGMLYNPGIMSQGREFPSNMPTALTWEDIIAKGPASFYAPDADGDTIGSNAVYGAWLNKFAGGAYGGVKNDILSKLQEVGSTYPGVANSETGQQGFADFIANNMAGYF